MNNTKLEGPSKTHRRLIEDGHVTFTREGFDQCVRSGTIPHIVDDSNPDIRPKKKFNYEETVKAIKIAGVGKPPIKPVTEIESLPLPEEGESLEDYTAKLGKAPTLTEVNIFHNLYKGKLQELKFLEESGRLIEREEVENTAYKVARVIRDKITSIPERLSAELASMTDPHEIKEFLYKEFALVLETLKEGRAFIDEQPDN